MSFETQVKDWVLHGFRQECQKIFDAHIVIALSEIRERANQIIAEFGLKFISQVSYVDNTHSVRVELSIPELPKDNNKNIDKTK